MSITNRQIEEVTCLKVTMTSLFTGVRRTRFLDITVSQYKDWLNGKLIQHAMPNLSTSDKEFIITGATDEEYDYFDMKYEDEAIVDTIDEIGKIHNEMNEIRK